VGVAGIGIQEDADMVDQVMPEALEEAEVEVG